MILALTVIVVLLVAIAMALALAHALEWPGKMRLTQEQYLAVQPIYYPGFTFGGIAEPIGILALLILVVLTPTDTTAFWLMVYALVALVAMHAAYWLMTHPVNNFWLKDVPLKGAGAGFFASDPLRQGTASGQSEWKTLRDRWEFSHVVRAVLGLISLTLLVAAIAWPFD